MTTDRFDALLDEALATGAAPAGASAAERTEIERLLAVRGTISQSRVAILREAAGSQPLARARFERFVAANRPQPAPARVPVARRRTFLGRLFATHRGFASVGAAIAAGFLAMAVLVASQSVLNDVETAAAQVLVPGDYVQVQGVVVEASGEGSQRHLRVQSDFDRFDVTLSASTSVVDAQSATDPASIKAGDAILVGGLVGKDRRIQASTLALSGQRPDLPRRIKLLELKEAPPDLAGSVVVLAISPDGQHGRVLIMTDKGEHIVVPVDGQSAANLVERFSTAVGARVQVKPGQGAPEAGFQLELKSEPAAPPANPPQHPNDGKPMRPDASANREGATFVRVEGVILGRQGNIFRIQTDRGPVNVVVYPGRTQLMVGRSGITLEAFLKGETAVGHLVAVTGGLDRATGSVNADVFGVGPKPVK